MRLQIPLFLRGVDVHGELFLDITKTLDISAHGALLAVPRHLGPDTQLQLTIPVPAPASSDYSALPPETPPIHARVRRHLNNGEIHLVGVEFVKPLLY